MLTYLLDSNIAIFVIRRRPLDLLERFRENDGRMAISVITLAELLHGAEKSADPARNLAAVEDFCSRLDVLPYPISAAQHYGSIRAALERAGTPIGVNDLHIAAHARSAGLVVVTNNLGEFERVPALRVEDWTSAVAI
jgi:tRNA(fMet)-specific endonuclease VapC